MTVSRRRDRVVYFRVSAQEYQRYQQWCENAGARSVSDLVRTAMDQFLDNHNADLTSLVTEKLERLEQAVSELNGRVAELSRQAGLGSGSHPHPSLIDQEERS